MNGTFGGNGEDSESAGSCPILWHFRKVRTDPGSDFTTEYTGETPTHTEKNGKMAVNVP